MKQRVNWVVSFLLLLTSCARNEVVYIVQTSDVHGLVFPYDFITGEENSSSLSHVQSFTASLRKHYPLLLLDNGDILQGQPVIYYSNYIDTTRQHVLAGMMNYMQYDAGTVGNHDIEAGQAVYKRLLREFSFPWLAANAVNRKTGEPYFKPYAMVQKGNLRIAVLGLTTVSVTHWLPENLWQEMRFQDMEDAARDWVEKIQIKEHPDLLIGLFHSGFGGPQGDQTSHNTENTAYSIAVNVPGFDIIFCGHDHRELDTILINSAGEKVLVLNPGSHARNVALVEIRKTTTENSQNTLSLTGEIVDTRHFTSDRTFERTFNDYFVTAKEYTEQPVGELAIALDSREALFGPSSFTDLVHQVQLDITGADISFTAPLSMDARLPKGIVRVKDLYALYRYENSLFTMRLTGKEIVDYLEYSYGRWFNTMKNEDDYLLLYRTRQDGKPVVSYRSAAYSLRYPCYNFDSARGIHYTVDVSKKPGNRITVQFLANGNAFDENKTYTVAVNSYRGSGGGGHLDEGAGLSGETRKMRIISSTGRDLRTDMMDWFRSKESINPQYVPCWKVIPAEWVDKAKKREYPLLFK